MLLQDPDDTVRLMVVGAFLLLDPILWGGGPALEPRGPLKDDFLRGARREEG